MKTFFFSLVALGCLFLAPYSPAQLPKASSHSTATASAGAATCNATLGTVTSEALTTAAGAAYTLTLTNSEITASSFVAAEVDNGTNTTAGLEKGRVTPGNHTCTILVWNRHATVALNGTIKIRFLVVQ